MSFFAYERCGGLAEFRLDPRGAWVCTRVGGMPDVTGRPSPPAVPTASGLDVPVYVTAMCIRCGSPAVDPLVRPLLGHRVDVGTPYGADVQVYVTTI